MIQCNWKFEFKIVVFTLFAICMTYSLSWGKTYYVDATLGIDTNNGTSQSSAWKTLSKLNTSSFVAGDQILFKRGGVWNGNLTIKSSGTQSAPITFSSYGTGNKPEIRNQGQYSRSIVVEGDWIVVEGFRATGAQEAGVYLSKTADRNIIRDCEITDTGSGMFVFGTYNLITKNYIHDLKMIVNTNGGDDDYGATGIWVCGAYCEFSYNEIKNCLASSYDYGMDGGVFEFNGTNVDNNYVHHNYAENNNMVFEIGQGSARNNTLAYNVFVNNGGLGGMHTGTHFGSLVENFRLENNTIVETVKQSWMQSWELIWFDGDPNVNTFLMRNNIFYLGRNFNAVTHKSTFTHNNNLFYLGSGSTLGFSLGTGEILGDPKFTNLQNKDYSILSGSPAINAGLILGYNSDYKDAPVPQGGAPDAGAFEYGSSSTPVVISSPKNLRILN